MAAGQMYMAEEVADAIFQDSGSKLGGDASDSDFKDSQADNSDFQASSPSESADSEPEPDHVAPRPIPVRHPRRRRDRQAAQIEWEVYEDIDSYESVWLQDYNERQGILVDTMNFTPVDFFYNLFMPKAAFELISVETNRYAMQYLDDTADPLLSLRFLSWIDTSKAEIKAFIALQIAMSLCQKPSIRSYWNKFWLTCTPFNSIMSRNRFELIQTFLHFNNAQLQVPRGQRGFNPLFKIQPLLDIVDPTYMQVYGPRRELSLDQSIVKFKGRIFFRLILPAKPTKWGIKECILAEAKTGYALKSTADTGKTSFQRDEGVGLSEQVILDLLEGFEDKGHKVYMDSFYSSPSLFLKIER